MQTRATSSSHAVWVEPRHECVCLNKMTRLLATFCVACLFSTAFAELPDFEAVERIDGPTSSVYRPDLTNIPFYEDGMFTHMHCGIL